MIEGVFIGAYSFEDLRKCPECGGNVHIELIDNLNGFYTANIKCNDCYCVGFICTRENGEDAITYLKEDWNTWEERMKKYDEEHPEEAKKIAEIVRQMREDMQKKEKKKWAKWEEIVKEMVEDKNND